MGKTENTLKKWVKRGCPVNREGRNYDFDVAKVFDWRIQQESKSTGKLDLVEERARLAMEQRMRLERERAIAERNLIPAKEAIETISNEIHRAKSCLLRIPRAIATAVPRECSREAEAVAKRLINEALAELAHAEIITDRDSEGVGSAT